MLTFLTFSLSFRGIINTGDRPIMALILLLFSVIITIPTLLISGGSNNAGLIAQTKCVSDKFGKIVAVLYAIFFLWYASVSEARFDIFASTLMYSQSDISIFMLLLVACSVFAASKGIEALGRAGVIFLFFLIASLVFIDITILGKFDILNITPPLYDGVKGVVSNGFSSAVRTVEPISLMIVAPHIRTGTGKGYFKWIICVFFTIFITFSLIGGVTGNYGDMQLFQMFTLTVLSGFSIFERLDALLSGLWVFCAFIKLAYYIYVAMLCLEQGFSVKLKKLPYIASGLVVFLACTGLAEKTELFSKVVSSSLIEIITLVFSVFIPLLVYFLYKIPKRKIEEKKEAAVC